MESGCNDLMTGALGYEASDRRVSHAGGRWSGGGCASGPGCGRRSAVRPMTLNAALRRLVLSSPDPVRLGDFYGRAFDYRITLVGNECRCEGDARSLWIRTGPANRLLESHFVFRHAPALEQYAAELRA